MKIKLFSDLQYSLKDIRYSEILIPFWKDILKTFDAPEAANEDRFGAYIEQANKWFEFTDNLSVCDLAILPNDWKRYVINGKTSLAITYADQVHQAQKPLIVFYQSDQDDHVPIKEAIVFRTSLNRLTRQPLEFAIPAFTGDLVNLYLNGEMSVREKKSQPVVGFCGYADSSPIASQSARFRHKVLHRLTDSRHIHTNFLIRDNYYSQLVRHANATKTQLVQARQVFIGQIVNSDYTLCMRGTGNYSFRFYETLCCGRIPIFIDTECVLPYDSEIDWRQFCIWVDQNEIDNLEEHIYDFHSRVTPSDFIALQHYVRSIWKNYLSPDGFFGNFHGLLKNLSVMKGLL